MAIDQDITNLPTPPSRSDSPSDFSDKADTFLAALPQLQTELNLYADEANTTQTAINTSETNAATSESNAQDWAVDLTGLVLSTDYSAKAYAISDSLIPEGAAKEWSLKTDGSVDTTEFSAKAYALGGTGVTDVVGAAKEWAIKTGSTVDGADFSAKKYAQDSSNFADASASAANATEWQSGITYDQFDVVIGSDGNTYRSLANNNLNNDPTLGEGSNWINLTATLTDQEIRTLFSASGDITYNSNTGVFSVTAPDLILTPENIAPDDNATGTLLTPELEASAYGSLYGVPMASAQWQISEFQDFATTVVDETVAGTSTTFTPSSNLDPNTSYYWRVRYTDDDGKVSDFSQATEFTTANIFTDQPTVTSPTDGETDIGETPTITSSAFNTVNGSDTHVASEWEITRVSDSVVVFDSGEDTTNLTSIDVPAGVLDEGQESYTVKVRHKGQTFGFSAYSPDVTFTTASVFFDYTDPANIGTAVNGGFLVGVIDTVAGTIDSQDDYQTGERYALIVAPKSLEDGSGPQWDSQDRTGEAGSFTRWDGLSSTDSILAKNDPSYEAFEHIRSIRSSDPVPADGGSDWYLPAMDELELIYRNLKPVTADNSTFDETRAFPGQQNSGFNPSSDPTGSAYTATGEPFQTSVTDFQDGGAEAVDLNRYWSSTDSDDAARAWIQYFTDGGLEGYQSARDKIDNVNIVRPVRRVPL